MSSYRSVLQSVCARPGTFQWAICSTCRGNGTVDHPAFANGFTSDEWRDMREDEQFDGESSADRYLAGAYDVPCTECEGGRVREPDEAALTLRQRRQLRIAAAYARIGAEIDAEQAAERAMGA